jgi:hypothetical protein
MDRHPPTPSPTDHQTTSDLTEHIPVGTYVAVVQADGRVGFRFVSTRWLRMCGLSREQFMADQGLAIEVIHPGC